MKAGAKVNFGKTEVFWPQDNNAGDKYQKLIGVTASPQAQDKALVEPTFDAKVKIDAQISVLVTPEVCFKQSFSRDRPILPLCFDLGSIFDREDSRSLFLRQIWVFELEVK